MESIGNILIVDDNEQNRNALNRMVISLGHVPILAKNGIDALALLKSTAIDIVLLDILMPGMDGYEVLNRIKKVEVLSGIPVIMISAIDDIDSIVRCIGAGAVDYFSKPFNHTILQTRIGACLEQKRLRDREKELFKEHLKLHEELKLNYEALQKAEQAHDAIFHMIVHDLRNPLTIVQTFAQHIMTKDDQEYTAKRVPKILKAAENMGGLITSVLNISKLESGEMPVNLSSLNVSQLINEVHDQSIIAADEKNIKLSFEPVSDNIFVMVDKELILRVIYNIINNGLKNTENIVKVEVERIEDNVVISVTDNGPGIPEEYKEKIFEKYFQIKTDKKRTGVGLGLAFCKMAVEAQNGTIYLEGNKGEGASFKVKLKVSSN